MQRLAIYRAVVRNLGFRGLLERRAARRVPLGATTTLNSHPSGYPVHLRGGASDLLVFDQIFVDREYRCLDGLADVRTIIDAGANVGYSSTYLLRRFPDARAICIEPDAGNFALLERNMAQFGDRATLVRAALWSEPGMLSFREETMADGEEWGRQVEPGETGDVPAVSIPTLMERHGLDRIDLLKIDVEGAEEAIFSADTSWLDMVGNIVIELHGLDCTVAFMNAIKSRDYDVSRCDELTVCLSRAA